MENKKANYCIACTVTQCKNHCGSENYCALNKIKVGTHESNPKLIECTDCESFEFGGKSEGKNGSGFFG